MTEEKKRVFSAEESSRMWKDYQKVFSKLYSEVKQGR